MSVDAKVFPDFVKIDLVRTIEEYEALTDKYQYEVMMVLLGGTFV
jgi:hypothetical protein